MAAPSWELADHQLIVGASVWHALMVALFNPPGAVCGSAQAADAVVQRVEALGQPQTWVFVTGTLGAAPTTKKLKSINANGVLLYSWQPQWYRSGD